MTGSGGTIGRTGATSTRTPGDATMQCGAGNEARTRDLNLGKVALYQLSYSRTGDAAPGDGGGMQSAQYSSAEGTFRQADRRCAAAPHSPDFNLSLHRIPPGS